MFESYQAKSHFSGTGNKPLSLSLSSGDSSTALAARNSAVVTSNVDLNYLFCIYIYTYVYVYVYVYIHTYFIRKCKHYFFSAANNSSDCCTPSDPGLVCGFRGSTDVGKSPRFHDEGRR